MKRGAFDLKMELVLERFALFAGVDAAEAARWQVLCQSAADELMGRLLPGADPEDGRLASAAAAVAYYRYCLLNAGRGVHSLKVGDVQLAEGDGGVAQATRLQEAFLGAAQELLCPAGFAFGRVRGHGC